MCDPGSAECQQRDRDQPITNRQLSDLAAAEQLAEFGEWGHSPADILAEPDVDTSGCANPWHRTAALYARRRCSDCPADRTIYVGEQTATYVEGKLIHADLFDQLVTDSRAELDDALGSANRSAPLLTDDWVEASWRRSRPGFARLLDLTDRT